MEEKAKREVHFSGNVEIISNGQRPSEPLFQLNGSGLEASFDGTAGASRISYNLNKINYSDPIQLLKKLELYDVSGVRFRLACSVSQKKSISLSGISFDYDWLLNKNEKYKKVYYESILQTTPAGVAKIRVEGYAKRGSKP